MVSSPLLLVFATLVGCRKVEPAPDDLDGLLHFFWQNAESEDDVLAEGFASLDASSGAALEDVIDGNVSRLTLEEAQLVPSVDADPANAAGIFMLNTFACDPEKLRELLVVPNQDELREGTYEAYERRFLSDRAAYEAGQVSTIDWEISLSAQIVLSDYSSELRGGVRDIAAPSGPAFVQRTWFTEPASFENNNTWTQDYQLELYYERAPGEIVHLYGMWRELDVAGFTSENSGVQRQVLNGMKDWDDDTETLCAGGTL
ncbi:MAG: hypothetical protein R3F61_26585 [Myxococcota bacterium]